MPSLLCRGRKWLRIYRIVHVKMHILISLSSTLLERLTTVHICSKYVHSNENNNQRKKNLDYKCKINQL